MPRTIHDLKPEDWDAAHHVAVLVRNPDGSPALWVSDDHEAGKAQTPDTYTVTDELLAYYVSPDEDLDDLIEEWKAGVQWEEDEADEDVP